MIKAKSALLLAMVVALVAPLAIAPAASANPFGPTYADNNYHVYYISGGVRAAEKAGLRWAMANSLAGDTLFTSAETTNRDAQTDVWAYDSTIKTGELKNAWAYVFCRTMVGSTDKCDQWAMVFNQNMALHPDYKAVGCHETGHTIGLGHYDPSQNNSSYGTANRSCLRTNPDHRYYSTADKQHLNGRY